LQGLNKELILQNTEKENRAAELITANKELAFQNEEKGKRAAELIIANKELGFQNKEKENRASELIIANTELAFQSEEKGKRAAELIIANKELIFQNTEKENRAAELIIANKELAFQNEAKENRASELLLTIDNLNKADEALLAVYKELEAFTYSVSHDLRAPLRAVNGYARILVEDYFTSLDSEGMSSLHAILNNSKKMGQLIDDLLAFSRLGRKEVILSEINMTSLVNSVFNECQTGNSTSVESKIPELLPAMGQIELIRQVWVNLISNAIKFSRNKPVCFIEIGSYYKDNLVVYYIKDKGAGFDMQYYDKLFGVFQRLHSQEEFEGTGIGLAIVKKIIQRHNGTIWAESKLNEGSCFYFSLLKINKLN
jgi:light-regulated signal transduction histidine kinase (bacteriophytochrome)